MPPRGAWRGPRVRPPWWPTAPVTVELDDGIEVVVTPCVRCGHPTITQSMYATRPDARSLGRNMAARGLCRSCYEEIRTTDEWDSYTPRQYAGDELLDEWAWLRSAGVTVRNAAPRLGLTARALETALRRARQSGDPRGEVA